MHRLRDKFTLASFARYAAWRMVKSERALSVELKTGERFRLRPPPAADLMTAYEVFVLRIYDPVLQAVIRPARIVDVGANVGYTCVLWAHAYPGVPVLAFEPHPSHVRAFRENLALGGLGAQIEIIAAAAGVSSGRAAFLDAENESGLVASGRPASAERLAEAGPTGEFEVPVVDFFASVGSRPIDVLKMDIEGGEYPILADPRFDNLGARMIALEWHNTPEYTDGKRWCEERLRSLGYDVTEGASGCEHNGMLFATREN